MGAVSAILYCSCHSKDVQAVVLDSPFARLKEVAVFIANQQAKYIPNFVLKIMLKVVRKTIIKKAGFDINHLKPVNVVSNIFIPAIVAFSYADEIINFEQFEEIFEKYSGAKEMYVFGDYHNGLRDNDFLAKVGKFFCHHLVKNSFPVEQV